MAFIRSRNALSFTSDQSAAVESIAKAFSIEQKTHSKTAEVCDAYRTRPCAFGPNCNRGESCTYANDSEKLVAMRCKFDNKCFNRGSCRRFHTGQTMDEYITVNNFTWPAKKVQEEESTKVSVDSSDHSFVIQIEDRIDSDEDLIEMDNEITEICAVILAESQKQELWNEMVEENYRLNRTESEEEFDNFVEYWETVHVYQKTLEKLHDESQYAQYQYADFIQGSMT